VGIVTRKELLPSHIAKFDRFHCDSTEDVDLDLDEDNNNLDGSDAPLTKSLATASSSPSSLEERSKRKKHTGGKRNITLDSLNC